MSEGVGGLDALRRERPAWAPWLALVEATMQEAERSVWDSMVPRGTHAPERAPRLTGARLSLNAAGVRGWLERLTRAAAHEAGTNIAAAADLTRHMDPMALFEASLCQDAEPVANAAALGGADPEAFQALAALVPVPFLQACHRQWAPSLPAGWVEPCCPVCGAWPAFAEVLGAERSRAFRCGRCGAGWTAQALRCPYCGMREHEALVSLVPENASPAGVIEACRRCRGYVKTFTTLRGCAPGSVMVEDLRSVAFDVAALERGYRRHAGPACALDVTIARW